MVAGDSASCFATHPLPCLVHQPRDTSVQLVEERVHIFGVDGHEIRRCSERHALQVHEVDAPLLITGERFDAQRQHLLHLLSEG